jgi:hypothetical protein
MECHIEHNIACRRVMGYHRVGVTYADFFYAPNTLSIVASWRALRNRKTGVTLPGERLIQQARKPPV